MNADGHRSVTADFDAGVAVHHLRLIVTALLVTGVAMFAAGLALVIVNVRRGRTPVAMTTF
jgi:biopolymer transport protein ExbB/TolQ